MSKMSYWSDEIFSDMLAEEIVTRARRGHLVTIKDKGDQMAKFLYPQAVADAFREYADAILTMFSLMDDELALPIAKAAGDEIKRSGAVGSSGGE